jgi:hypothetical protein
MDGVVPIKGVDVIPSNRRPIFNHTAHKLVWDCLGTFPWFSKLQAFEFLSKRGEVEFVNVTPIKLASPKNLCFACDAGYDWPNCKCPLRWDVDWQKGHFLAPCSVYNSPLSHWENTRKHYRDYIDYEDTHYEDRETLDQLTDLAREIRDLPLSEYAKNYEVI